MRGNTTAQHRLGFLVKQESLSFALFSPRVRALLLAANGLGPERDHHISTGILVHSQVWAQCLRN